MKKRLFCLLLALLMLSGCAQTGIDVPEQTTQETVPPTTEAVGYQTLGSGVTVRADYSNYRPVGALTAQYTRISDEWLEDLQPVGDCEMIYPFAGGATYTAWDQTESFNSFFYGIADNKGRILADPVYESVYPLYDNRGSYDGLGNALPLWLLRKNGEVEKVPYEYDGQTYYYNRSSFRLAVASLDGSFVTPCKYTSVLGFSDAFIGLWQDDDLTAHFELVGFDGTLLLSSADLQTDKSISYDSYYYAYADGLLTVPFLRDGEVPQETTADWDESLSPSCDVYFVDLNGNPVLGPYDTATEFSEGYAFVGKDDDSWFIDRSGNHAFGTTYSYDAWGIRFFNGTVVVRTKDGRDQLLDRDGNVVMEAESLWRSGNDRILKREGEESTLCDLAGNVLCELGTDWWPLNGSEAMLTKWGTDTYEIKTIDGSAGCTVEDATTIYPGNGLTLPDGQEVAFFAICRSGYDFATDTVGPVKTVAYDANCRELRTFDGALIVTTDAFSGEAHAEREVGTSYFPLDESLNPIVKSTYCNYYNGILVACTELGCSAYDASGNLLLCYPFLTDD